MIDDDTLRSPMCWGCIFLIEEDEDDKTNYRCDRDGRQLTFDQVSCRYWEK